MAKTKDAGFKFADVVAPIEAGQSVATRLWEELPTHKRVIAKTRNNENIYGTYIKVPDILRRLQDIYGMNYSVDMEDRILMEGKDGVVVMKATITVNHPEAGSTTVSDFGSAPLFVGGRFNENAHKAAATDALKRAVRWLGIGMFQYENDEPEILRNETSSDNRQGGKQTQPKRDLKEEVAVLVATSPDKVDDATTVMAELGVYDPEEMDEEQGIIEACNRFRATPKQILWAFKDKRTGERFLEAFEEGVSVKQFLDELFAKAKR